MNSPIQHINKIAASVTIVDIIEFVSNVYQIFIEYQFNYSSDNDPLFMPLPS